jgi:hypothetical protein
MRNKSSKIIIGFIAIIMLAMPSLAGLFWDDFRIDVYRVEGSGGVEVFRNGNSIGEMKDTQSTKWFAFNDGDTFMFVAKPSSGWTFDKFCADSACNTMTTDSRYSGKITQGGNLYVYFKKSIIPTPDILIPVLIIIGIIIILVSGVWRLLLANPIWVVLAIFIIIVLVLLFGIVNAIISIGTTINNALPWNWRIPWLFP